MPSVLIDFPPPPHVDLIQGFIYTVKPVTRTL